MRLWRPVGLKELSLLFRSDMTAFPPRLPEQPIFYPVLNRPYAEQIAREWNTLEPDAAGYVTRFEVPDSLARRYDRQVVGSSVHEELWIPAEDLPEINRGIRPPIVVEASFFGAGFAGITGSSGGWAGRDAIGQFLALANRWPGDREGAASDIDANREAVFHHVPFWAGLPADRVDISEARKRELMDFVEQRWAIAGPGFPLPQPTGSV